LRENGHTGDIPSIPGRKVESNRRDETIGDNL
jgi:hypothetical protein